MKQQAMHALRFLEIGGLTSIPVIEGAETPLRNTYDRMQRWQDRFGRLAFTGGLFHRSRCC